ncbi:hypothetical protein FH972_023763 [Carpinus fangiana]|uniref:Uncharacterized protein n=1 Tax=Carpinus fangiana TaxID=176857 RepID=A0A5N6KWL9_9ROSI|nr:hypothetical protein FH972_023763 [Carpinus fangiana]
MEQRTFGQGLGGRTLDCNGTARANNASETVEWGFVWYGDSLDGRVSEQAAAVRERMAGDLVGLLRLRVCVSASRLMQPARFWKLA